MSCFVCEDYVFQSVAKVCFQYGIKTSKRRVYPLTLEKSNQFLQKIAKLNCMNVSLRYKEEPLEFVVKGFKEEPLEKITVQDIKYCDCWMYQTCDYLENDSLFKKVAKAVDWAKSQVKFTKEQYSSANWC